MTDDDMILVERIRSAVKRYKGCAEKKMFGGICFFLNGNMLVGVWKGCLVARLGPTQGDKALREAHVRAFDITGKPMRNWVLVEPKGIHDDDQLREWVERAKSFVRTLPKK